MSRRKLTAKEYKNRAKKLRSAYRGFSAADGFDLRKPKTWTVAQRAKVTRHTNVLDNRIQRRDNVKLRAPRKLARNKKLQKEAQYERFEKDAKYIYYPAPADAEIKIRYSRSKKKAKRNKPIIRVDGLRVEALLFDKKLYAKDPDKELRRVLAVEPDAVQYQILQGDQTSNRTYIMQSLQVKLKQLRADYANHAKWLLGVRAYVGTEGEVFDILKEVFDAKIKRRELPARQKRRKQKIGKGRLGRVR